MLAPGGAFVAKVFQGGSEKPILDALKRNFATVRHAKPPASRKDFERAVCGGDGVQGTAGLKRLSSFGMARLVRAASRGRVLV